VSGSSETGDLAERIARGEASGKAAIEGKLGMEEAKLRTAERERKAANVRNVASILGTGLGAVAGTLIAPGVGTTAGAGLGSALGKLVAPLFGGEQVDPSAANDIIMGVSALTTPTLEEQMDTLAKAMTKLGVRSAGSGDSFQQMLERFTLMSEGLGSEDISAFKEWQRLRKPGEQLGPD
jgi:hypothetical protein